MEIVEARDDVGCVSTGLDGSRWWAAGATERASDFSEKKIINVKFVYPYNTHLAEQDKKHKMFRTETASSCSLCYLRCIQANPGSPVARHSRGSPERRNWVWQTGLSLMEGRIALVSTRVKGPRGHLCLLPTPAATFQEVRPSVTSVLDGQRGLDATRPIPYGRRHLLASLSCTTCPKKLRLQFALYWKVSLRSRLRN